MNIERAIETQLFVLQKYCTTKEDREDIALAIKALEFYKNMQAYMDELERQRK
ncbi:MAG: hypothetical protein Q4B26_05510 [Eubacteriales bacterium]|nr:hypothetical protein [Eubacteriales bacterium]